MPTICRPKEAKCAGHRAPLSRRETDSSTRRYLQEISNGVGHGRCWSSFPHSPVPLPRATVREVSMTDRDYDDDIAHHPHDGLVKHTFTNPEAAAVELRQVLPAALCSRLDRETLEVESSSFTSSTLKPRHSDILYSIGLRGSQHRISIYVALEHQSTPDAKMAARFMVYLGRFYERYLRKNSDRDTVPMVIPVLLYQGPDGWTLPQRLSEVLDVPPDLLEVFPSPIELTFAVDDLGQSVLGEQVTRDQLLRERGLAQAEMARTMLWLYFNREAATGERAAVMGLLLDFIAETWGPEAVTPFITYLISCFEPESPIGGILEESLNQETRHLYTTIREQLLAEGMAKGVAKGKAEGMAEGKAEGMARMLERLLDTRGLTLTEELRERLSGCKDEALLQRWFDRAITASTPTEVFDD